MPFEPLDARELALRIARSDLSPKWGHPKYTSKSLTSQEMRTLCEAVVKLGDELEALKAEVLKATINAMRPGVGP